MVFVIPAYNEERTILDVLRRVDPFAAIVIVIDDGSRDGSRQLVAGWCRSHPNVALLAHDRNRGMADALLSGFAYVLDLWRKGRLAADDVVVTIDADGQHLPEECVLARRFMDERGLDVVLARRDLSGYPRVKRLGNWGLSLWASMLSGYRFRDVECGLRLLRVGVLADILPYYAGRNYGCAQELGILPVLRGWRLDNTFRIGVAYYRKGARLRDGVNNLLSGLFAFARVTFGLRRRGTVRAAYRVLVPPRPPEARSLPL